MNFKIIVKRLKNINGEKTYLLTINNIVSKTITGNESEIFNALRHLRDKLQKLPQNANYEQIKGAL